MERQETDWGEILWMDGETGVMPVHSLQVGLVSIPPGGHQAKHLHYEEQVIYVTEGCALSVIDGAESRLGPGDLFHWKAGVEHEIWNTGGGTFPNREGCHHDGRRQEVCKRGASRLYEAKEAKESDEDRL